jgi:hypothetical protein
VRMRAEHFASLALWITAAGMTRCEHLESKA